MFNIYNFNLEHNLGLYKIDKFLLIVAKHIRKITYLKLVSIII